MFGLSILGYGRIKLADGCNSELINFDDQACLILKIGSEI